MVRTKKPTLKKPPQEDIKFAKGLIDKGLVNEADMARVFQVLQFGEDADNNNNDSNDNDDIKGISSSRSPSRPQTAGNGNRNSPSKGGLPRNWKQAEQQIATQQEEKKISERPRTAPIPSPTVSTAPTNGISSSNNRNKKKSTSGGMNASSKRPVPLPSKLKLSVKEMEAQEITRRANVRARDSKNKDNGKLNKDNKEDHGTRSSFKVSPNCKSKASVSGWGEREQQAVQIPQKRHYVSVKVRRACEARIEYLGSRLEGILADGAGTGAGLDLAYFRLCLNEAKAQGKPQIAATSHVGSDFTMEVANYCSAPIHVTLPVPVPVLGIGVRTDASNMHYVEVCDPGISLLHLCSAWNMDSAAELLLSKGALVNRQNMSQETPLHWAAACNSYKTAELLIDFGADLTFEDASGSCALTCAARRGHLEMVSLLLSRSRGTITEKKLQDTLLIARVAVDTALDDGNGNHGGDGSKGGNETGVESHAAKTAALVLIQRHLQLAFGAASASATASATATATASATASATMTTSSSSPPKSQATDYEFLAMLSPTVKVVKEMVDEVTQKAIAIAIIKRGGQARDEELELRKQEKEEEVEAQLSTTELETEISRLAAQCNHLMSLSSSATAAESALVIPMQAEVELSTVEEINESILPVKRPTSASVSGARDKKKDIPAAEISNQTNNKDKDKDKDKTKTRVLSAPNAVISPLRKRIVPRFYPAGYVPFLHDVTIDGGSYANGSTSATATGDVLICIEQCSHCDAHNFSLWHDEAKYNAVADRCLIALVRSVLDKGLHVRLFAMKEVPRAARTGALEVTCSVRVGSDNGNGSNEQKKGRWVTTTLHSKLDSSSWPSVKGVAARGVQFVTWALETAGLVSHLGNATATTSIVAGAGAVIDEIGSGSGSASSSSLKKLQVEGQFMSWLIRLSMSSAAAQSPDKAKRTSNRSSSSIKNKDNNSSSDSSNKNGSVSLDYDPLGVSGSMLNQHEWTKKNVQSFGAFYNPFARYGNAVQLATAGVAGTAAVVTASTSGASGSGRTAVKGRNNVGHTHATQSGGGNPFTSLTPFGDPIAPVMFEYMVLQHFFVFDNHTAVLPSTGTGIYGIESYSTYHSPSSTLPPQVRLLSHSGGKNRDRDMSMSPERKAAENVLESAVSTIAASRAAWANSASSAAAAVKTESGTKESSPTHIPIQIRRLDREEREKPEKTVTFVEQSESSPLVATDNEYEHAEKDAEESMMIEYPDLIASHTPTHATTSNADDTSTSANTVANDGDIMTMLSPQAHSPSQQSLFTEEINRDREDADSLAFSMSDSHDV